MSRAVAPAPEEPLLFRTPTRPLLPGHIPLEASVPCSEPFDDHDWLFSIDWDGARALLYLDPDSPTRIQGETLDNLAEGVAVFASASRLPRRKPSPHVQGAL